MPRTKIASIKLNSGQGSYFDELTRIHLTAGNPIGDVYSGMNLTNIRRAIKSGRLSLIGGTLGPNPDAPKFIIEDGQYKLSIPKTKPKDDRLEKAFDNFVKKAGENMIEKIKEKKNKISRVAEENETVSENEIPSDLVENEDTQDLIESDTSTTETANQNFSKSKKKKKRYEKTEAE